MNRCLKLAFIGIFFLLLALILAPIHSDFTWASSESDNLDSTPAESNDSQQDSWLEEIDMRWGGRFKISGALSEVTDDTFFEPVGTGKYYDGSANFRLINETFLSDSLFFEVDYELIGAAGDSIRKQQELKELFPNIFNDVFFIRTPLSDDRRLMDLTDIVSEDDGYFLVQRLDRLYLALNQDWGTVRIGRQAITWGNGFIFNPMDLFNPFPPTAVDRDYKVGDDMVNAQFADPNIGDVQLLYVIRRDPDDRDVKTSQASLAAKAHVALGTTEFNIMGAKHFKDAVVGVGSLGYLKDAAWRVNATWTFLDDNGKNGRGDYLSLVTNIDYSWTWWQKNFYGFIEYYYNGLGQNNYAGALLNPDVSERLARGELFVLGQNYFCGTLQAELHPLVNVYFTAINNLEDPSGILQPRATWDITQNMQITGGANIYYGANSTEFGGFTVPGPDLRSKAPDSAYLWLIYYF
ncbi:MAG: hypothetical protein JSV83_21265 [Desulfobacterales bacterium]|nr:MAG: hypothetical protein JSV83_21265 [Desulfobacterales bacterium]